MTRLQNDRNYLNAGQIGVAIWQLIALSSNLLLQIYWSVFMLLLVIWHMEQPKDSGTRKFNGRHLLNPTSVTWQEYSPNICVKNGERISLQNFYWFRSRISIPSVMKQGVQPICPPKRLLDYW